MNDLVSDLAQIVDAILTKNPGLKDTFDHAM